MGAKRLGGSVSRMARVAAASRAVRSSRNSRAAAMRAGSATSLAKQANTAAVSAGSELGWGRAAIEVDDVAAAVGVKGVFGRHAKLRTGRGDAGEFVSDEATERRSDEGG